MTVTANSGSSATRSSSTLASVGQSTVRSIPMSFISARRGSGSKNASMPGMALGLTPSRMLFPLWPLFVAVLPQPPGTATRSKVGFGMYWLMWSRIASFLRPSTSTYLIASL